MLQLSVPDLLRLLSLRLLPTLLRLHRQSDLTIKMLLLSLPDLLRRLRQVLQPMLRGQPILFLKPLTLKRFPPMLPIPPSHAFQRRKRIQAMLCVTT
jgi:hypothetical protein